jgi:hypothetical protein
VLKVLGNGKSLLDADLSGDTIGTNRISRLHIPTYYVGVSRKLFRYWFDDARHLVRYDPVHGKQHDCRSFVADWMNLEGAEPIKVNYDAMWKEGDIYGVGGGSLFVMLQVGLDLGYSNFELLGCDGFVEWEDENDINHWDEEYWAEVSESPSPEKLNGILEEGHKVAAEKMKDCRVQFGTPSPFEVIWRNHDG